MTLQYTLHKKTIGLILLYILLIGNSIYMHSKTKTTITANMPPAYITPIEKAQTFQAITFDDSPKESSIYQKLKRQNKCHTISGCKIGGDDCDICGPITGSTFEYHISGFGLIITPNYPNYFSDNITPWKLIQSNLKNYAAFTLSGDTIYDNFLFSNIVLDQAPVTENREYSEFDPKIIYLSNKKKSTIDKLIKENKITKGKKTEINCKEYNIFGTDLQCFFISQIITGEDLYYDLSPILIYNTKGSNSFLFYPGEDGGSFGALHITSLDQ